LLNQAGVLIAQNPYRPVFPEGKTGYRDFFFCDGIYCRFDLNIYQIVIILVNVIIRKIKNIEPIAKV
jgi:hypothetical protein